jgi:hypothetical protein
MLRSNGSKRRLVKASNRVSRLMTRPGPGDEHPQESELATGEGDRVTGIAAEPAGIEIEDEAREAHRECGFPR